MQSSYIELSYWQLAVAAALVLANGLISISLNLALEKQLLIASLRMTVQLLLVGLILQWVFALASWYLVISIMLVMTVVAGISAVGRGPNRYRGMQVNSIASVWISSWLVTSVALLAVVQVEPWYRPQYAIPLLGMILGNSLNGISLAMDRFLSELMLRRNQVDALLAMGATSWEAARQPVQDAVRAGMIPTINVMMVAGIVSLPGMMTGQLLAGVEPVQAIKYQIVIMFLIASSTALGAVGAVALSFRCLFSKRHQFVHEAINTRS